MWKKTLALLSLCVACIEVPPPDAIDLTSFQVTVKGIYQRVGSTRPRLAVTAACRNQHGGSDSAVPAEKRGTKDCRYAIPRGEMELDLEVRGLAREGGGSSFTGPVSFRVVPGDLTGDYAARWAQMANGRLTITVKSAHPYGQVRVWAEQAPPQVVYTDGGVAKLGALPADTSYTYVTGVSAVIHFEDPTIANIQVPDGFDNRSSPFVGQFLTLGQNPETGQVVRQNCPGDPNDGKAATLVVTGTDPTGFFVTDLTACRVKEETKFSDGGVAVTTPEPDGGMPGTFGATFIYNYSYPEGLDQGDLLWTLSGSVQEFASHTQLTFPAWSIREKVRKLPQSEWDKYLKLVTPVDLNLRHCGLENEHTPNFVDVLCGHKRQNLKIESLESALVRLRHVRFPSVFQNCDLNGDDQVPFFCEGRQENGSEDWGACGGVDGSEEETSERECNLNCTTGRGDFADTFCSEKSNYRTFGQFLAELPGHGPLPPGRGYDASLPARTQTIGSTTPGGRTTGVYDLGVQVYFWCNVATTYAFGGATVTATPTDTAIAANELKTAVIAGTGGQVAFRTTGFTATDKCYVTTHPHTRVNVIARDAIPDFEPDCRENDPDPVKANDCKNLHGATYDVVGHLRHVQPGRPRWAILPRDADDVCCHPGPGLACPKPLRVCP